MAISGCSSVPAPDKAETDRVSAPLYYHIFVRSFADSNGDQNGDLQGIIDNLDHLQSLGVTGILLTPLYPSQFYHNYFAEDFYGIDPEFGDMETYIALVEELHRRDMTIIMDQEIQYVSGQHEWYVDAKGNPSSEWDGFALFSDAANEDPVGTLFGRTDFKVWPDQEQTIVTVDMLNPDVRDYFEDYLLFWMDPNSDGDFSDGVDGYRIDHMMDDLDNAGVLTGLFENFWVPIFDELREKRSDIVIVAEQYDWGYGESFLKDGEADMVFSFPIWDATSKLDASLFAEALHKTNEVMTDEHNQFLFIENHDTNRFAGHDRNQPDILKLGAAVNLLTGWTPILYYGQEIGMTGEKAETPEAIAALTGSIDDARDIPVRQAFRWHPNVDGGTLASWYRELADAYPLPDSNQPGDGVSVVEQERDVTSLLNTYRKLAELRQAHPGLAKGSTRLVTQSDDIVVFSRTYQDNTAIVAVNFGDTPLSISWTQDGVLESLYGNGIIDAAGEDISATLNPFDVSVWAVSGQ